MTHFGIICPAETGHLNTMFPLGGELKRRGHRVTLIGVPDAQSKTLAAGLDFQAIAESEFPPGRMAQIFAQLGELSGQAALRYTISMFQQTTAGLLRDAPGAIAQAGVEALLVDQSTRAGGTVAEHLGIPFINVCSALVLNQDDSVPPFFTPWSYSPAMWARLRNRMGYKLLSRILRPIRQVVDDYRRQWNLPLHSSFRDVYSKLAIVSQQPAEFEFPRRNLPQWFHFTGPYHDSTGRPTVDFPFEKLTGQPLIYASMGTLQNRSSEIFRYIAEACIAIQFSQCPVSAIWGDLAISCSSTLS